MVERALNLLQKEWSNLNEAALLLGLSAFVSQILSLFRDRLLAGSFGAGSELDIYYAAFRLPDLIYVSVASLVSITILIPFIVEYSANGGTSATRRLLDSVFTLFFCLMVIVSAAAFFLLPYLAGWIAPGFDPPAAAKLISLSRILLLSPFLLGLSNLFGSITQSFQRFFIYALSPILYNLGIIAGIIFLYPRFGLIGLAGGVILGALFHWLIQAPTVKRLKLLPRFSWQIDWSAIGRLVKLSLPRTLTLSAHQLTILILLAMASLMKTGSISVFNFAYNLQSVPLSIVGMSYSVAAFPTLVKFFGRGERERFVHQVAVAARHIIFWSIPAAVAFIVLRAQIVRVILGAGRFDWSDTRLTAAALACFAISVVAQSLILLFVRAYYAAGRTRKPLLINVFSSLIIIILAWIFSFIYRLWPFAQTIDNWLRVQSVSGAIVLILPLAFSLGSLINVFIFWRSFTRDFGDFASAIKITLRQIFLASVIGGAVSYSVLNLLAVWFNLNVFWGIFSQGLLAGLAGLAAGIVVLYQLRSKELDGILSAARRRFWEPQVAAEAPEEL